MGTGPLPEVNDSINGNQQYSNSIASPQNIEVTESALMDTQRSMDKDFRQYYQTYQGKVEAKASNLILSNKTNLKQLYLPIQTQVIAEKESNG